MAGLKTVMRLTAEHLKYNTARGIDNRLSSLEPRTLGWSWLVVLVLSWYDRRRLVK
jgi:hypothetical protein